MKWTVDHGCSLDDVLTVLSQGRVVYALERDGSDRYRWTRANGWDPARHTLGHYRPMEPFKSLLFPPLEQVGAWGEPGEREPLPERIAIGVKSCDLSSLQIQDHVFLEGGFTDPHYAEARDRTVLVSCDCTAFLDVCFCVAVGKKPYSHRGYDVNISPSPAGDVLEAGSQRGERLLQAAASLLRPAGDSLVATRDARRADLQRQLLEHNARGCGLTPGMDFRAAVQDTFESSLWEDFAADCVECGACNFVCCTCHCFALADGIDAGGCPARSKQWDACLFSNFARTAGGGNPRPRRAERLRNRFDKKFVFFPQTLGKYACDGCGRCTEACIGKIDIRAVLKRAVDDADALHAHSGDH